MASAVARFVSAATGRPTTLTLNQRVHRSTAGLENRSISVQPRCAGAGPQYGFHPAHEFIGAGAKRVRG
jgi:hypothetical protein